LQPLQELCAFLEAQMGLPSGWLLLSPLTWLLLVSPGRRIQAAVAAEAIRDAHPVRPALQQCARSCGSAVAAGGDGDRPGRAAAAAAAAPDPSLRSATHSSGPGLTAMEECSAEAEADQLQPASGPADWPQRQSGQQLGASGPVGVASAAAAPAPSPPSPQPAAAPQAPSAPGAPASPRRQHARLELDRRVRVRAALGVRVMWVSLEERRRGLARRLLDAARSHFMAGYVPHRHELAFR
jgi:hypothetical protein